MGFLMTRRVRVSGFPPLPQKQKRGRMGHPAFLTSRAAPHKSRMRTSEPGSRLWASSGMTRKQFGTGEGD